MDLVKDDAIVLAGATGSVGGATLHTLLREGARVVVLSRDLDRASEAIEAALVHSRNGIAVAFAAELGDPAQAAAAVSACVKEFGRIDAVVSLAGSGWGPIPFEQSKVDNLRSNFASFVEPAYNLAVAALRAMLEQPYRDGARSRGRIVTVSAGSSKAPAPGRGLFGAAKAGVNVLMQAIAREHKVNGIVANALVLGGVATEAARDYFDPADFAAAATPQEVADVLTFLASDRASGINGALVDVNAREVD
jgi:3-oxoacyl-[acyl-carrier protein] reductase